MNGVYATFYPAKKLLYLFFAIAFFQNIEIWLGLRDLFIINFLYYTNKVPVNDTAYTLFIHNLGTGEDLSFLFVGSKILKK